MEAEGELRYMHRQAVSTYVNFTLMQEDVVNGVGKRVTGISRNVENRYRRMKPRIRWAKLAYHAKLRRLRPHITSLKRKITDLSNKVGYLWTQSNLFRPIVQRTMQTVSTKVYARVEPSLKVAQEAAYLSTVSAIEEVSSAGITFLDALAEKQKEKVRRDQERQLEHRRRLIADRRQRPMDNKRNKKRNKGDEDDIDFTPSFLQRKVKGALEHSLRHSKRIANCCSEMFPLALSLFATGGFLFGSVLLFFGIPTSLIWLLCLLNFVRLIRRFSPLR